MQNADLDIDSAVTGMPCISLNVLMIAWSKTVMNKKISALAIHQQYQINSVETIYQNLSSYYILILLLATISFTIILYS